MMLIASLPSWDGMQRTVNAIAAWAKAHGASFHVFERKTVVYRVGGTGPEMPFILPELGTGRLYAIALEAGEVLHRLFSKWALQLLGASPFRAPVPARWEPGWVLSGAAKAVLDVARRRAKL